MIIVLYALTALLYGTLSASAWRSRLRFADVPGDVLGVAPQSLSPRDRGLLVERRLHAVRSARVSLARPDSRAALRAATRDPSADHWASNWLDALPPLLTLEKLLFRLIWAGFAVLTLALASGILFSEQLFHQPLRFDHKTVFAILSWVMFGGVLTGRTFYGWRGRTALRWVLASFVALLLAYVGSRFVLEVLLHRPVV